MKNLKNSTFRLAEFCLDRCFENDFPYPKSTPSNAKTRHRCERENIQCKTCNIQPALLFHCIRTATKQHFHCWMPKTSFAVKMPVYDWKILNSNVYADSRQVSNQTAIKCYKQSIVWPIGMLIGYLGSQQFSTFCHSDLLSFRTFIFRPIVFRLIVFRLIVFWLTYCLSTYYPLTFNPQIPQNKTNEFQQCDE